MKKLLLTSAGFENPKIGEEFLRLVDKPVSDIKILFIPTASRTDEELYYVEESKKELLDLGIKKENIIVYDLDREITDEELANIDSIYICGGNSFYLLYKVRASKFDEKIKEMVNRGVVYVGVSAGSVLVGSDIKISGIKKEWDKNDVGIKDLSGLNLTDKIISPHYENKDKEIIEKYEKETGKKITLLTDNQSLLVEGEKVRIIE